MLQDQSGQLDAPATIDPDAHTGNVTGNTIDLANAGACTLALIVGSHTDGTHAFTVQESDDDSNWSDVSADDLVGSFSDLTGSNTSNQRVGYKGGKRYVRVNSSLSGVTNGAKYTIAAIRGHHRKQPV